MSFAVGSSSFGEETLPFQVATTDSTFEATGVVVLIQGFDPSISCCNGKSTANTFGCEQVVPVLFTVGMSILQIKWAVPKGLFAVWAGEAIWMPLSVQGIEAVLNKTSVSNESFQWWLWLTLPLWCVDCIWHMKARSESHSRFRNTGDLVLQQNHSVPMIVCKAH